MNVTSPHAIATPAEALRALASADAEERRLVVRALESAPPEAACGALHRVLGDEDWRVRKEGIQLARALAEKPVRTDVVRVLVDAICAPSDEVALQNAAVEALAALGAFAVDAVERLLRDGTAPHEDARKLALEVIALARLPRSIPVVLQSLDDADPNVRAAAVEALGAIGGSRAIAALGAVLEDPSRERFLVLAALEWLNRLSARLPAARVRPLLEDRILRRSAIDALGRTSDETAIVPLIDAIEDRAANVMETAIRSAATLVAACPTGPERARQALAGAPRSTHARIVAAATGGDVTLRRAAISLAPFAGSDEALEAIVRALEDDELADDAELALRAAGARGLDRLLREASSGDPQGCAVALRALPRLAPPTREVMAILGQGLRGADRDVAAAAAHALAMAIAEGGDASSEEDIQALIDAGASADERIAQGALHALRNLARARPGRVHPHLRDTDAAHSRAGVVCALLAVVGTASDIDWLLCAASAESPRTRRLAHEALAAIGGDAATEALALAITDESPEVVLGAVKWLGRTRSPTTGEASGVEALVRLATASDDPSLVAAAARALGSTGDRGACDALRPLLDAHHAEVVCAALEALSKLETADLAALAIAALEHSSTVVVRSALDLVEALVDRGTPDMTAEVARALAHPSWEVRRRAAELLGRLDPAVAAPLLRERAARDADESVRAAIERVLWLMDGRGDGDPPPLPLEERRPRSPLGSS